MNLHQFVQQAPGTRKEVAASLGIDTPQLVYDWTSGKRPVPLEWCPRIEARTRGKVKCEDLRPDLPWVRIKGRPVLVDPLRMNPRKLKEREEEAPVAAPAPAPEPERRTGVDRRSTQRAEHAEHAE